MSKPAYTPTPMSRGLEDQYKNSKKINESSEHDHDVYFTHATDTNGDIWHNRKDLVRNHRHPDHSSNSPNSFNTDRVYNAWHNTHTGMVHEGGLTTFNAQNAHTSVHGLSRPFTTSGKRHHISLYDTEEEKKAN